MNRKDMKEAVAGFQAGADVGYKAKMLALQKTHYDKLHELYKSQAEALGKKGTSGAEDAFKQGYGNAGAKTGTMGTSPAVPPAGKVETQELPTPDAKPAVRSDGSLLQPGQDPNFKPTPMGASEPTIGSAGQDPNVYAADDGAIPTGDAAPMAADSTPVQLADAGPDVAGYSEGAGDMLSAFAEDGGVIPNPRNGQPETYQAMSEDPDATGALPTGTDAPQNEGQKFIQDNGTSIAAMLNSAAKWIGGAIGIGSAEAAEAPKQGAVPTQPQGPRPDIIMHHLKNMGYSEQEVNALLDATDPNHEITNEGLKRLNGTMAVYNYYVSRGEIGKAQQAAAGIILQSQQAASRLGAMAEDAIRSGKLKEGADLLLKADNMAPNGMNNTIVNTKNGQFVQTTNQDGKVVRLRGPVTPEAMLDAATGMKNGKLFWQSLSDAAQHYLPKKEDAEASGGDLGGALGAIGRPTAPAPVGKAAPAPEPPEDGPDPEAEPEAPNAAEGQKEQDSQPAQVAKPVTQQGSIKQADPRDTNTWPTLDVNGQPLGKRPALPAFPKPTDVAGIAQQYKLDAKQINVLRQVAGKTDAASVAAYKELKKEIMEQQKPWDEAPDAAKLAEGFDDGFVGSAGTAFDKRIEELRLPDEYKLSKTQKSQLGSVALDIARYNPKLNSPSRALDAVASLTATPRDGSGYNFAPVGTIANKRFVTLVDRETGEEIILPARTYQRQLLGALDSYNSQVTAVQAKKKADSDKLDSDLGRVGKGLKGFFTPRQSAIPAEEGGVGQPGYTD